MKASYTLPGNIIERADIVIRAVKGAGKASIARAVGRTWATVSKWISRFIQFVQNDLKPEWSYKQLYSAVFAILSDAPRSGTPETFGAEVICKIIAVALRAPEDFDRKITHWSLTELTAEIIRQKIVQTIDRSTVGRILQSLDLRPHKIKYWLTPKIEDETEFRKRINKICETYRTAAANSHTEVLCVDEKTGIQALEFINPTKPVKEGSVMKVEFEYKRHGTLCLTPTFNVKTGCIDFYTISETRDENDFVTHIRQTLELATFTGKDIIWIMDQLNTHKSESMVRLIAEICGITEDLGVKGKSGILESMKTRMEFLEDPSHKVRIVFTPKHCSWLNQVEIWFGVLSRKLLKRLSCESKDKLREKIEGFIKYFNENLAKPYRWTYEGKPLKK